MTKREFLSDLSARLSNLPQPELQRQLDYYAEILDDMLEDGLTEDEATARLGSPAALAADILSEAGQQPRQKEGGLFQRLRDRDRGGPRETRQSLPTDGVHSLELQWVSGRVELLPHTGAAIELTERASRAMTPEEQMDAQILDGTLVIRFCRSERTRALPSKELTVLLPAALAGALQTVSVKTVSAEGTLEQLNTQVLHWNTVSGDLEVRETQAAELELHAVSGDFELGGQFGKLSMVSTSGDAEVKCAAAVQSLRFESRSGDLELHCPVEELHVHTTSGDLSAELRQNRRTEFRSTSGDATLHGQSGELELHTISGDLDLQLSACPAAVTVGSTSGDCLLSLPEGSGFTLHYHTVSGDFRTDFPAAWQDDALVSGDGRAKLHLTTTSGDIRLRRS